MTIEDYRQKLINKILSSPSKENAVRFVDTAMKSLVINKVHGHIIARFTARIIADLEKAGDDKTGNNGIEKVEMAKSTLAGIKKKLAEKLG